ncbi:MAG: penicillin acylase family protein, partial [Candidatus Binatia bacterium]
NILPPGQGRYLNGVEFAIFTATGEQPTRNTDQISLYEDLVAAAPALREEDLARLFKDASLAVAPEDVQSVSTPPGRPGTLLLRDSFGVPHVFGQTRADVFFGAGYVSGEDRLFMMDTLRHLGRGRLSEFLGASPANLASDCAQRKGADYTEEELLRMALNASDPERHPVLGPLAAADLAAFVDGVNAFIDEAIADPTKLPAEYPALQIVPRRWKITDSVAISSLIGATFSPGGGGQLQNARFLKALKAEGFDPVEARGILDDFHFAEDPEAPTTTDDEFPFLTDLGAPDPDAVVVPDDPDAVVAHLSRCARPTVIDGPLGPIPLGAPAESSNALLVAASHSASGNPIAVMGPQVGYFSPEILMEIGLHGPGVHARGATFPGVSLYVLLGRGRNYAWSATTANGDHIDIRAVELCEPDGGAPSLESRHYFVDDGVCIPMGVRTDTWLAKPSAGGLPVTQSGVAADPAGEIAAAATERIVVSFTTERTRHGIVQARGLAGGKPHAFVKQRSSYTREVDATLAFTKIHDPDLVPDIEALRSAFVDFFSYSFNWFLIHDGDVAFQLTGRYPVLPQGVDPDMPISGDPEWDGDRLLTKAEIPFVVNPAKGFITNWNNKQAPLFRAADQMYAFGPTQRVQHLTDGVVAALDSDPRFDDGSADGKVSLVELTKAMAIAATQDLYGAKVLPLMLDVLSITAPTEKRLARARELLDQWQRNGAHRRDLDSDGEYDEQS